MAKVVTVAQQKGGAGKTTLLTHLAVAFRDQGLSVAALDLDPQGSLTLWGRQRGALVGAAAGLPVVAAKGSAAALELRRLTREHDLVLVDSPPHTEAEPKLAIREADLVLVPVQPSPMDLWATRPTLLLAAEAGVPVLVVLNRMPPRGRLAGAMAEQLESFRVPIAKTRLGNRAAYAAALAEGRAVSELQPKGIAAAEMAELAREVLARLR